MSMEPGAALPLECINALEEPTAAEYVLGFDGPVIYPDSDFEPYRNDT